MYARNPGPLEIRMYSPSARIGEIFRTREQKDFDLIFLYISHQTMFPSDRFGLMTITWYFPLCLKPTFRAFYVAQIIIVQGGSNTQINGTSLCIYGLPSMLWAIWFESPTS